MPAEGTVPRETVRELSGDKSESARQAFSYVLVVDDEPVVCQFLARCLEGWGYAVRQAGSAAEALEMMVADPASLVLCDIRMPGQDGLWLVAQLHAHWPHTPVVMATAIDDVETIRQTRELGAADYVTKPIVPEQLLQVIRRVTTPPNNARLTSEASPPTEFPVPDEVNIEAEYKLESPVKCPACGERIATVKVVRLLRVQANFTSTLPRRGRIIACPHCVAVIPAELTNF